MNGKIVTNTNILVLNDNTPEDVAKALIENGHQKEPFFVFDMDDTFRRIKHFKRMMPRIQIFYAMKSNDSDKIIKLAASLGLGFDCASPGEISKILNIKVSPRSIIFAVPNKTPDWMKFARDSGVQHTTFDSSYELKKLKQYWPDASLLIRIKADGDSICSNDSICSKLGEKFGCDFETEAIKLLEEAAALELKVVGVAFHVSSACKSEDTHKIGLKQTRALFDHEARAGRKMRIVNIGGGFMSDRIDRIDQVSTIINRTIDELFPDPNIQIFAEPGRYLSDSSCKLYCSINNVRRVTKRGEVINMIYLNDGLHGTIRYTQPWHKVKKFELELADSKNETLEKTILWGPSCNSNDQVMKNDDILFPRCTPNDWLVFNNRGAYSFNFATYFSCLEKPQIRSVISNDLWNKIKNSKVFNKTDFITNPNISEPLPTTLPSVVKNIECIDSNVVL